jgi:TolB-like protein/class 3 adenylate cyclase/cytochrome c-type biogenesis protein CcmH/NrfG
LAAERVGRKIAAILAADVAGYSRLAGADEERTLARLRALRSDLIDPAVSLHHGRVVKRTGDGSLIEFRSVVDAVRCALEVQSGMVERNAGLAPERRIEFRVGIHLGDVVEEEDGDLMGDGVNIAARLESIADPGGICLSEDAWRQVRDRVSEAFTDRGEQSLKNIAHPMHVYALSPSPPPGAERLGEVGDSRVPVESPTSPRPSPPPRAEREQHGSAPRLSIVVLPFANIGGDPEQEYFVDGVTESLTTDLSRIAGSFVIARNTAYTYKGKPFDVKQIGRELGVRYVLEGSVQRGGNRMRVNVQLIDTESGTHLWAERFDKPVGDLFDMQDEIVARLANQLSTALTAQEARRAAKAPNPDSMDHYFQGMAWYEKAMTPPNITEARRCFERALELDPDNVDALVKRANMDHIFGALFSSDDRAARLAAAEASVNRALSLAPNHAFGHFMLGIIYACDGRADQSIAVFERALELDRNLAFAHSFIGHAKCFLGRSEETEAHVREALRLSPRDAFAYVWMSQAGQAKLCLGADEEAVTWLRRAIEANRNFAHSHYVLAAALVRLGRLDEAQAATKTCLELDPTTTIQRVRAAFSGGHPIFMSQTERMLEEMRLAGMPEG